MKLKKPIRNVVIFGDSYSTFRGYIPEKYSPWYSEGGKPEQTDVFRVEDTWWHSLASELSLNIVRNDSWSGSTLAHFIPPEGSQFPFRPSFIERFEGLVKDGFFNEKIDTVMVFGCTNDSWKDLPLGEIKFDDFKENDLHSVCSAICYFTKRLKEVLPEANIILIINTGLKPEITRAMKEAAEFYGTFYVELENIGKQSGHPNVQGMIQIKEQVKSFIENI